MRALVLILRLLIGGFFVFSGFVKAVDPKGTAYKLEKYFAGFAQDGAAWEPFLGWMDVFTPYALTLAVILVVLEMAVGFALIFGVFRKLTAWILLAHDRVFYIPYRIYPFHRCCFRLWLLW